MSQVDDTQIPAAATAPPPGTALTPAVIHAALQSGDSDLITVDERAEFTPALGESRIERAELKTGGFVSLTRFLPADDITMVMDPQLDYMLINLIVLFCGRAQMSYPTDGPYPLTPEQGYAFRHFRDPVSYRLPGRAEVGALSISLPREAVARYFDHRIPDCLAPMVAPEDEGANFLPFAVTEQMRTALAQNFAPGLTGPLRDLQYECATVLFFAMAVRALEQGAAAPTPPLTARDTEAGREAYRILAEALREPPSLGELAQAVGLTERRLSAVFRELYGTTVFDVHRALRLDHARRLIEAGEMAIKEIAWAAGYQHTNNFSAAFAARFGMPPAAHARLHRRSGGSA
jgi:AraC-like DNA-binding protein